MIVPEEEQSAGLTEERLAENFPNLVKDSLKQQIQET